MHTHTRTHARTRTRIKLTANNRYVSVHAPNVSDVLMGTNAHNIELFTSAVLNVDDP